MGRRGRPLLRRDGRRSRRVSTRPPISTAPPSLTKFRRITWPLVRPTTLFLLVTGTIGSFQVFQIAYIATRGGPQLATTTFVYHIWITAFELLHLGKGGGALGDAAHLMVMTVAILQFRFMSTDVEY